MLDDANPLYLAPTHRRRNYAFDVVFQFTRSNRLRLSRMSGKASRWSAGDLSMGSCFIRPSADCATLARTSAGRIVGTISTISGFRILDWVPFKDTNLMGVESIAVDPGDPNRVYLACGMYTNATSPNAAILRSDDRGNTFQRADVPFKMGGNEDGRGNGERLAVDPNDGRVIYFGSRQAGLWRSTDRAVTWSRVSSFPDVTEAPATRPATRPAGGGFGRRRFGFFARSSGIDFVIFDPAIGRRGQGRARRFMSGFR